MVPGTDEFPLEFVKEPCVQNTALSLRTIRIQESFSLPQLLGERPSSAVVSTHVGLEEQTEVRHSCAPLESSFCLLPRWLFPSFPGADGCGGSAPTEGLCGEVSHQRRELRGFRYLHALPGVGIGHGPAWGKEALGATRDLEEPPMVQFGIVGRLTFF